MNKAVYAGSFDCPTKGHYDVMKKAVKAFGRILVVIADNPAKKSSHMFSVAERIKMINDMATLIEKEINGDNCGPLNLISVDVLPERKYLARFAEENGAMFLIRGIRDQMDFKFENDLYRTNRRIAPHVETIYLMPDDAQSLTSSSWVKSLIGYVGWVDQIKDNVTPYVLEEIKKWYLKKRFLEVFMSITHWFNAKDMGEKAWKNIATNYGSRSYHNLDHILKMIENYDFFYGDSQSGQLIYSIFMHDIDKSEDESAKTALELVDPSLVPSPFSDSAIILKLIAATKHDKCEYDTETESIIASLDLITLAGNYEQYSKYNKDVFNEYFKASGKNLEEFELLWIQGRSDFIKKFLARKYIFPHSTVRNYHPNSWNSHTYEDQARHNLTLELEYLTAGNISHLT